MYGKNKTTLLSRKIRQMSPAVAQVLECFLNSCSQVLWCRCQTYFMWTNELYFGLQTNYCIKVNMEITLYYSTLFISILPLKFLITICTLIVHTKTFIVTIWRFFLCSCEIRFQLADSLPAFISSSPGLPWFFLCLPVFPDVSLCRESFCCLV